MTKYSKFNIIYLLQKWLDSVPGQTFMNYAYSWGASIVILGALFKLTHLPGANVMLFLGMGTEVFVFFIAGFDRPFDKTEDGKEIPTHMENVVVGSGGIFGSVAAGQPVEGGAEQPEGEHVAGSGGGTIIGGGVIGGTGGGGVIGGTGGGVIGGGSGGTVVIGGGGHATGEGVELSEEELAALAQQGAATGGTPAGGFVGGGVIGGAGLPEIPELPELPEIDAEGMEQATTKYVDQLNNLVETLQKVAEQSERLTRDSEEMENLNRTLTGISKVYEMQLKGASQQIGTIDEINDQTRKMAEQIAELNRIYARMIEAMTTNMPKLNNNGN